MHHHGAIIRAALANNAGPEKLLLAGVKQIKKRLGFMPAA